MKRTTGYVATILIQDHGLAAYWTALARRIGCRTKHVAAPPATISPAPAQIMVLDLEMPEWDGLRYVSELRRSGLSMERPWIIALKTVVTAEDVDAAMAAGCNDLLAHHASQQEMLAALETADRALHDHDGQAAG